jgi:hypothetical protein
MTTNKTGALQRAGALWLCSLMAMLAVSAFGCEDAKPPETPGQPPPPGNCCMRNAEPTEQVCGQQVGCCRNLERDECEAKQGLWFHSLEGCRGAC